MALFNDLLVVVRGGGDLASGVVYRLVKAGFPVIVTELAQPLVIRRTVAFASAVFDSQITVEGLTARRVDAIDAISAVLGADQVPVLIDEGGAVIRTLRPVIVVDARVAKRNLDTRPDDAPVVIALGPGFEAGRDCHAVIETNCGHTLGRVIRHGTAEPNTGHPGSVQGFRQERVLRAPAAGYVIGQAAIGDQVTAGAVIARVEDQEVHAPFDGVLRGLIHPAVRVPQGLKIGDVDPRGVREHCFTISDKALAIGGGVIEAVLSAPPVIARLNDGLVGRMD